MEGKTDVTTCEWGDKNRRAKGSKDKDRSP
jgi:hypothetical protein